MPYDLHVVRTDDWLNAEKSPITREDVDSLVDSDTELGWSATDYYERREGRGIVRYYFLTWRGRSCFIWLANQIVCSSPDDAHTKKLIDIAVFLKAQVIGDDGERYSWAKNWFGKRKLKVTPA